MPNPLFSGYQNPMPGSMPGNPQGSQNIYHLKNIMQMMRTARNPESVLEQIAQKNPAIQQVMQMCKGKDPQQVFCEVCKQKGIDPNEFISMMK